MNYAICIKRQWDTCSVTYANEIDSSEFDFQMINVDASRVLFDLYFPVCEWNWFLLISGGTSVIPEKMAGVEIFNCNDDFISVNSIRLCGEKLNDASRVDDLTLNAPITDLASGPIVLPVRSNDAVVGRGFRINYKLNPCQPTIMPATEITEEIITEEQPVSRTRIRIRKKYYWKDKMWIFISRSKCYTTIYVHCGLSSIGSAFVFLLSIAPERHIIKCTWAAVFMTYSPLICIWATLRGSAVSLWQLLHWLH